MTQFVKEVLISTFLVITDQGCCVLFRIHPWFVIRRVVHLPFPIL